MFGSPLSFGILVGTIGVTIAGQCFRAPTVEASKFGEIWLPPLALKPLDRQAATDSGGWRAGQQWRRARISSTCCTSFVDRQVADILRAQLASFKQPPARCVAPCAPPFCSSRRDRYHCALYFSASSDAFFFAFNSSHRRGLSRTQLCRSGKLDRTL